MVIDIPIRTISGANAREHWARRKDRVERERCATWAYWHKAPNVERCAVRKWPGWRISIVRRSPGKFLDSDNLPTATKSVRDELARLLGVDEGSPRYEWVYRQVRSPIWSVLVVIEKAEPPDAHP